VPKSGEFYTFDEVTKQLRIDEGRLKRLVSEGEIRAFREGDEMKFKKKDIDNLDSTDDATLDFADAEAESSETLTDDLIFDEGDEVELTDDAGMATAEISSQDTFVEDDPVGMSTEPIDLSDDLGDDDYEVRPAAVQRRPAAGRPAARARYQEDEGEGILMPLLLVASVLVLIFAGFVVKDLVAGGSSGITQGIAESFYNNFGK
jgi:excisionase family DNA binding protein